NGLPVRIQFRAYQGAAARVAIAVKISICLTGCFLHASAIRPPIRAIQPYSRARAHSPADRPAQTSARQAPARHAPGRKEIMAEMESAVIPVSCPATTDRKNNGDAANAAAARTPARGENRLEAAP